MPFPAQAGLTLSGPAFLLGLAALGLTVAAALLALVGTVLGLAALRSGGRGAAGARWCGASSAAAALPLNAQQALSSWDGGVALYLWPGWTASLLGLASLGLGVAAARRSRGAPPAPLRSWTAVLAVLVALTAPVAAEGWRRHARDRRWGEHFMRYAMELPERGCGASTSLLAYCAARHGDSAALESFLARDAGTVNRPGPDGWTALHHAAARGDQAMVRLLLGRGADPSSRTPEGQTPAELSARHGHAEVAAALRRIPAGR